MVKIRLGVVISTIGLILLTFNFTQDSGYMSKIPLTIFFLVIIIIGIMLETFHKDYRDDFYGEFEGKKDVS